MMTQGFSVRFAKEWVDAWNAHDLDRIPSHYEDDFEMSSRIASGKVSKAFAHYAEWQADR